MAGIAQRHRRQTVGLALLDADRDSLRRHGLPIAEPAIDDDERRRIDNDFDFLVGNDEPIFRHFTM